MSRTTVIVLIALGATFAGFVRASNAQRLRGEEPAVETSAAAGPQSARLDWRETFGDAGEQLVFTVAELEVTTTGWRARIGMANESSVNWHIEPNATPDGTFGLQLFESGDSDELDERNRAGTLPAVRAATAYVPTLPSSLAPDASWEGVISARGSLVAGAFVRVVFGTLVADGKPPEGLPAQLVWITDHTYELER